MKEKPIFEEVFAELIRQPNFGLKLLIGGGLSFIPIINIFAFGYLYRFSLQLRQTGRIRLPDWNDWAGLFSDGLKFAVVWLAYWFLPILLGFIFSVVFYALLGALAYLFISSAFLVASIMFCSALYRFQMRSDYKDLLDIVLITRISYIKCTNFILPALVFIGICAFGLPIYGFTLFVGFLLLISQTSLCYRSLESI